MSPQRPPFAAPPAAGAAPPAWRAGAPRAWQPLHATLQHGEPSVAPGDIAGTLTPSPDAAGAAAALQAREAELAERIASLDAALAELAGLRRRVLAESEGQLVALALQIAAEVLQRDVPARAEFTARMAREAITALAEADAITLSCAPADLARLRRTQPALLRAPGVQLQAAPGLGGGVRARCSLGTIDASVRGRLQALAAAMLPDAPPEPVLAEEPAAEPGPEAPR